jgi:hypothetical protein
MNTIKILDWKPLRKGSLLGFAKTEFVSGLIFSDVPILTGPRGPWASPPAKAMIGRDGVVMKDEGGKIRYSSFIEFTSKQVRDRWSSAVIDAMRTAHPEAFSDGEH